MTFFFLNPESQQCELSVETPSHVGVRPRELFKPLLSTGLAASSSALRPCTSRAATLLLRREDARSPCRNMTDCVTYMTEQLSNVTNPCRAALIGG